MPRDPQPPSRMLSIKFFPRQAAIVCTQHWKLHSTKPWVRRLEGWRSGQAVMRNKARGAVDAKTAKEQGAQPTDLWLSVIFKSLQLLHQDTVFIAEEMQPSKPSKPFWERCKTWYRCDSICALCYRGHKLPIITMLGWFWFLFVCHLSPQPPLSALLCVPEGWLLVISWCSCPCDPTSDKRQLKERFIWVHRLSPSQCWQHGWRSEAAIHITEAVRRQKRPPGIGGSLELFQSLPL